MPHPEETAYDGMPRRRPPREQGTSIGPIEWPRTTGARYCRMCGNTGTRNVYGGKGRYARGDESPTDPVLLFTMYCTCSVATLVRVRAGLRAIDLKRPAARVAAADQPAELAAAWHAAMTRIHGSLSVPVYVPPEAA